MKKNNIVINSLFSSPLALLGITIIIIIICSIFMNLMSIGIGEAFDIGLSGNVSAFKKYIIKITILISLVSFFQFLDGYTANKFFKQVFEKTKIGIFTSVSEMEICNLNKIDYGEYSSYLINDMKILEENFFKAIRSFYKQLITLIIAIVFVLKINVPITIFIVFFSGLPILIPKLFSNRLSSKFTAFSMKTSDYVKTINEILNSFDTIKTYNSENSIQKMHEKINNENLILKKNAHNELGVVTNLATMSALFIMMGSLLLGMIFSIKGYLTVGEVFSIVFISSNIIGPLSTISSDYSSIISSKDIISKFDILENDKSELFRVKEITDSIRCENLSLKIDKQILKEISYNFEIGKKYAIIGGSGSGKSTLIKCILGFFDYDGQIYVDGKDLKSIDMGSLYNIIGYVPQKVSFFYGSIRDNLNYFNLNKDSNLLYALDFANITDRINRLPDNIDTVIDRNVSELSGGEKQRIGIARAIAMNKHIYILDEATSALDGSNYKIVENNLLNKKVTMISITHRLEKSILEKYDEILVLDRGNLVAKGNYNEIFELGYI